MRSLGDHAVFSVFFALHASSLYRKIVKTILRLPLINRGAQDEPKGESMAKVGLGPAKGKDFASSLGPVIVTREAIADKAVDRPGVYDLNVPAKVNDVEMSKGNLKDIFWSFGEITARASDTVDLMPGVVELEIERIGNLKNSIGGKKK